MNIQKLGNGTGDITCFGPIGTVNRKITICRVIIVLRTMKVDNLFRIPLQGKHVATEHIFLRDSKELSFQDKVKLQGKFVPVPN
jgi:hypothetical protein